MKLWNGNDRVYPDRLVDNQTNQRKEKRIDAPGLVYGSYGGPYIFYL